MLGALRRLLRDRMGATTIEIVPHRGAGKVSFAMTRTQVEQAVGRPPKRRMKRSAFDLSEIDFYDEFAVHYDANDKAAAIDFHRGVGVRVEYEGYDLFAHPAHEAREWARARDQDLETKDGFLSRALGLAMYAPMIDEPDLDPDERSEPAQGFLVFRPRYYEDESEWRSRIG
jgi:hypothetical protein